MKKISVFIFFLALIVSCKKEPLPELPDNTTPYFLIKGDYNGNYIDLNVGQEGIKIAHGKGNINGIETYFGQILSPSDDILIKMEFTRPEKVHNATSFAAFDFGNLGFLVHKPGCLQFGFGQNQTQANYMQIRDEYGDFVSASSINFKEYGQYDLAMKFDDFNQNSFEIPVKYGYKNIKLPSDFELSSAGTIVSFSPLAGNGHHDWFINGNLVGSDTTYSSEFPIGIHVVSHKYTDENGNSSSSTTLMRIVDYVLDWQMSMNSCSGASSSSNYGKVNITFQTNGEIYQSSNSLQNLNKSFSVKNEEYVLTSGPDPSRALFDFVFDAVLVNGDQTDSLTLEGMTGTFNIGL